MKHEEIVIVFVDVQEKLSKVIDNFEEIDKNLEILLKASTLLEVPLLWLEQYPRGLGTTNENLKTLLLEKGLSPIVKNTFSAYLSPSFRSELELLSRKHVILVGTETHICVYQTAKDLLEHGYEVDVIVDCVGSRTQNNKDIGIDRMISYGAGILSLEMLLFELIESADHQYFKDISRLIK